LARIYGKEIEIFGTAGLCGVTILALLAVGNETKTGHLLDVIFVCFFLLLGCAIFFGGVVLSGTYLLDTIDACWPIKA